MSGWRVSVFVVFECFGMGERKGVKKEGAKQGRGLKMGARENVGGGRGETGGRKRHQRT